jgi:hypothetical protein
VNVLYLYMYSLYIGKVKNDEMTRPQFGRKNAQEKLGFIFLKFNKCVHYISAR